ncbi:MAG: peptidoglycan DD-metalloendopeptidase family protein [Chitinophagaceae bacterium]|nr:peptidoglycan DD-metalloendopeptidase family protein [Chitinophagaceae bacterium]
MPVPGNSDTLKICPLIDFDPRLDKFYPFDFSRNNAALSEDLIADTRLFSRYIEKELERNGCKYGIGGYNEHRTIYARSTHFDDGQEPRRLHLGTDIWGPEGSPVYAPLDGSVHSFHFNNNFGDYGATLIVAHRYGGEHFFALYGHLDLASIQHIKEGDLVTAGKQIACFGSVEENGHWPPHLHFQIIKNMEGMKGDYPGVCRFSERSRYLQNCPDPDFILQMNQYILKPS